MSAQAYVNWNNNIDLSVRYKIISPQPDANDEVLPTNTEPLVVFWENKK